MPSKYEHSFLLIHITLDTT